MPLRQLFEYKVEQPSGKEMLCIKQVNLSANSIFAYAEQAAKKRLSEEGSSSS